MKRFYTSYYAKKGRDPKAVAISAKAPAYFYGRWYLPLAPSWEIINGIKYGNMTESDYVYEYMQLLNTTRKLNPQQVVDDLDDGSILLCYEVPSDFCHRHIAAEWIQTNTGIIVQEWKDPIIPTIVDELIGF